jgi:serine/threonine-protein kinase RsbT
MTPNTETVDLGRRLLAALTARVHLVQNRLRDRIAALDPVRLPRDQLDALVNEIVSVVALFGGTDAPRLLREIDAETGGVLGLAPREVLVRIEEESSVVEARRQAGLFAAKLGFRAVQRTKVVTATSELARNIHMYVGTGEIAIRHVASPRMGMLVHATDSGPGISNVEQVLAGAVRSKRGMGLGLHGVKAMADDFTIRTGPAGTSVSALFCAQGATPAA